MTMQNLFLIPALIVLLETDYKIIDNDGDEISAEEFCREYSDSLNICQERHWDIDDWKEIVVPILK